MAWTRWLRAETDGPALVALWVGYVLLATLGLEWAMVADAASPVWPAAGVALFGVLRYGRRAAAPIFAAVLFANLVNQSGGEVWVKVVIAIGNTAAAFVAVALLRRWLPSAGAAPTLAGATGLVIAAAAMAATAATIGVTALAFVAGLGPAAAAGTWLGWAMGDWAGALLVTPLLLAFSAPVPQATLAHRLHFALCLVVAAAVTVLVFVPGSPLSLYLVFPALIWAALGFRMRGAAAALLIVSTVAIAATALAAGPFARAGGAVSDDLARLQQFLVIASATTLLLAAAVEERRAEAALKAVRERLDFALEAAGMVAWDADYKAGSITQVGDVVRFFGQPMDSPDDFRRVVHPDDLAGVQEAIKRTVATGEPFQTEYRIRLPDGTIRWALDRGRVVSPAPDLRVSGVNTDITRRKLAELELAASEERLRLAQEAAAVGTWDHVAGQPRAYWSPELFRLYGLPADRPPPTTEEWRAMIHPHDREAGVLVDKFETEDVFETEFRIRRADTGEERWLEMRARAERDATGRIVGYRGVNMDVTRRKVDEERQRLLMAELDHRVKNVLATIQALVARTAATKGSVEELAATLQGRVQAMARAHSMLARNRWEAASLRSMIEEELRPYGLDRVALTGPALELQPRAALSLSLAVHELATNAAKYGALSVPTGRLLVDWAVEAVPGEPTLVLRWAERGGPPIEMAPARRGFGSVLTQRVIAHEFGGTIEPVFAREGLSVTVRLPAVRVLRGGLASTTAAPAPADAPLAPARLDGLAVLVVEDMPLVATALEADLDALGARVIGPYADLESAREALGDGPHPDAAVLDVNLGGVEVFPLARALAERGIPFLFATGYGDEGMIPGDLRDRPRLAKPFMSTQVAGMLAQLTRAKAA